MTFLTAEWRDLVMLNWELAPGLLAEYVPRGTELDLWNGRAFVSLVGFRFIKTRVMSLPLPYHVDFEEINLRFYVRRTINGETRRGVVFIKELVPRVCIALVARRFYNENYVAVPMSHWIETQPEQICVQYGWLTQAHANSLTVRSAGDYREPHVDSQEEFITEHYWGYCRQRNGSTVEYQVRHPRWQVARISDFSFSCDAVANYGRELGEQLSAIPASVFLANGSRVEVGFGRRM